MYMMEGIDASCDAALLIGYHSRAGLTRGVIGHTFMEQVLEARINGQVVSEGLFNAAVAGHFGVPVALISGDDVTVEDVAAILPTTEGMITKWGLSLLSAKNLSPKVSQERIRAATQEALGRLGEKRPLVVEKPVRFEVDFSHALYGQMAAGIPGVECVNSRTIAYTGADMLEVVGILRLMLNVTMGHPRTGGRWY